MGLARQLSLVASERPDQAALIEARGGATLRYGELMQLANGLADRLAAAGLQPGQRLLVEASGRSRTVAWLLAGWLRGAVVVPLSPDLSSRERDFFTEHAGAALAVSAAAEQPGSTGVQPGSPLPRLPGGAGAAAILYTSGSTGDPKGVELSHRALLANAARVAQRYGLGASTRFLSVLPLFHGHGLVVTCLAPLLAGGTVVLDGPFDAFAASRFWSAIDGHGVTVFSSVPPVLRLLVALCPPRSPVASSPLRFGLCASASLPPSLQASFEGRFGCPVGNSYGLTETAAWCSYGEPDPQLRAPGSVGRPEPGALRVLAPPDQVGEIQVRGPTVMTGYFRNPEATRRAFDGEWLRTGDLGRLDPEGRLFLAGRRRDVINHGGFSVYPEEVDEVLVEHPCVSQAATVERASDTHGEAPVAFVVLCGPVDSAALRAHCRGRLAPHKIPVEFLLIDDLPRGATHKVCKDQLRAMLNGQEA